MDYKFITSEKLRELLKAHPEGYEIPKDLGLRKEMPSEIKAIDRNDRTVTFRITDGEVGRDNDTINGLNL